MFKAIFLGAAWWLALSPLCTGAFSATGVTLLHHCHNHQPNVINNARLSQTALFLTAKKPATSSSSSSSSPPPSSSTPKTKKATTKDNDGHVTRELPGYLWAWGQTEEQNAKASTKLSIQRGLGIVSDIIVKLGVKKDDQFHSDLMQEGAVALMAAMTNYRSGKTGRYKKFEPYAKDYITRQLVKAMEDYSSPISVPHRVLNIVKQAKEYKQTQKMKGNNVTSRQVAEHLGITPETLRAYLMSSRAGALISVESTVEITDPLQSRYFNRDDWDKHETVVLENGHSMQTEENVEEYFDESLRYEGDDEMWIHENQVAAPLRDMIPDHRDPSPDELALNDMILHDVDEFINQSLEEVEAKVIRLRYGLDFPLPMTQKQVAEKLNLKVSQVRRIQHAALEKLRDTFAERYVENEDDYFEDTV